MCAVKQSGWLQRGWLQGGLLQRSYRDQEPDRDTEQLEGMFDSGIIPEIKNTNDVQGASLCDTTCNNERLTARELGRLTQIQFTKHGFVVAHTY